MLEFVSAMNIGRGTVLPNRMCSGRFRRALVGALLVVLVGPAMAEDRWVTDEFEIMMRSGKGKGQRIVRQLKSGTRLEVIEIDTQEGYAQVRTSSGQDGWVLSRYLRSSPTAKLQLPSAQQNLQRSEAQRAEMQKERDELRRDKQALERTVADLQASNSSSQNKIERITKLSASTIQVDEQNHQLKQRIADNDQLIETLNIENERYRSRSDREWFLVGAAVLIAGLLLGLILPRIRWKKKSSWSDF
jgi:SH3 domain protein